MLNLPVNPKTGKLDGVYYTFGNSEVCVVLAKILLELQDTRKFHKVTSKLADYTNGLKTIASIPKKAPMRGSLALLWRERYLKTFDAMLTKEEGGSFLQNLAKTRYKEIMLR